LDSIFSQNSPPVSSTEKAQGNRLTDEMLFCLHNIIFKHQKKRKKEEEKKNPTQMAPITTAAD
jgi:hypothetical protein